MSVTTEDVQEWVKQAWNANTTLAGLVPGGLVMGRVQDPAVAAAAVYATFKVTDGPVTRVANGAYLQTFKVEVTVYDESGAADLGKVKPQVEATFSVGTRSSIALPSGRTLQLLHSVKEPGGLDEDEATRQGQSVKVGKDTFEVLCQG